MRRKDGGKRRPGENREDEEEEGKVTYRRDM